MPFLTPKRAAKSGKGETIPREALPPLQSPLARCVLTGCSIEISYLINLF